MQAMLLLVVMGGLSGCVLVEAVKEGIVSAPGAEVVSVTVVDQTAEGVAVEAVVELSNPNEVELPIEGVDVAFSLEGVGEFVAPSPATVTLPPRGTQRMTVRAALPLRRGSLSLDGGYRVGVTVRWVPPGEVRAIMTDSGVPLPFVVARGTGALGQ